MSQEDIIEDELEKEEEFLDKEVERIGEFVQS